MRQVKCAHGTCLVPRDWFYFVSQSAGCWQNFKQTNVQTNKYTNILQAMYSSSLIGTSLYFTIFHSFLRNSKLNLVLFLQCPVWILDHPVMGHNGSCGYVRIACCVNMNLIVNFARKIVMVLFWLSLFHLVQRGTREQQLVFRESGHSASHWVSRWGFGSIDLGLGDIFQKFYT